MRGFGRWRDERRIRNASAVAGRDGLRHTTRLMTRRIVVPTVLVTLATIGVPGPASASGEQGQPSIFWNVVFGAGIGALVDRAIRSDTVIFESGEASTGATVSLSPFVTLDSKGLLVSVSF